MDGFGIRNLNNYFREPFGQDRETIVRDVSTIYTSHLQAKFTSEKVYKGIINTIFIKFQFFYSDFTELIISDFIK